MQPIWQQQDDPAGNIWASAIVALAPIVFFFQALTRLLLKGHVAGTVTVVLALGVALLFDRMPGSSALASAVHGCCGGLWPIAWIIVATVMRYKISAKTRPFDVIRASILSVTPDQRLQPILLRFRVGAFLDGVDALAIGQMAGRQFAFMTVPVLFCLMAVIGALTTLQAHALPWIIPGH